MLYNVTAICCLLLFYNFWSGNKLDKLFYSMLPMTEDENPETVFFQAVASNEMDKVARFLKLNDTLVNSVDQNKNRTPLHLAASKGYLEMVDLLVDDFRADINAVDHDGHLPITLAGDAYHASTVKYLVSKGSVLPKDSSRMLNEPKVEEFFGAVYDNDLSKVRHMLRTRSVDVNSRNVGDYGKTAAHVAAARGFSGIMRVLADEFDANLDLEDEIGDHPVHAASDNGFYSIVKFLLKRNIVAAVDFTNADIIT